MIVQVKTDKVNRFGQRVQFWEGLAIQFDGDGVGEVDTEKVELLKRIDPSIELLVEDAVKEDLTAEDTKNPLEEDSLEENPLEGDAIEEVVTESTEEDVQGDEGYLTAEDIESLKVDDLREACRQTGLPEDEWKNLLKGDLVEYVKEKLLV